MIIGQAGRESAAWWAACACIALGTFCLCAWLGWRSDYVGNLSDSLVYLAMADFLSPWSTAPVGPGLDLFRDFRFPPLYPLLLALGGGSSKPLVAYLITALTQAAMVVAVAVFARRLAGGAALALGIAVVLTILPASQVNAMNLVSEPLFMAMTYSALALFGRAPRASGFALALIGLAVLARSAGVALVAATVLHLAWRRPAVHWRQSLTLLLMPLGLWGIIRVGLGAQDHYAEDLLARDFASTVRWLLDVLAANIATAGPSFAANFDLFRGTLAVGGAVLVVLPATVIWTKRLRRGELDALWLLIYLGMIAFWPHPGHLPRFLYVILPLLLIYASVFMLCVARKVAVGPVVRWGVPGAFLTTVLLCAAPASANVMLIVFERSGAPFERSPQRHRYRSPKDAVAIMRTQPELIDSLEGINEHLPPDACITTAFAPYVAFYGRRRAVRAAGVAQDLNVLEAQLARCSYVFMMAIDQWPGNQWPAMYPHDRIKDRLEVIEVKLADRSKQSGKVLTMLARVQPRRLLD